MSLVTVRRWRIFSWIFLALMPLHALAGEHGAAVASLAVSMVFLVGSTLGEALVEIRVHQLGESYRSRTR